MDAEVDEKVSGRIRHDPMERRSHGSGFSPAAEAALQILCRIYWQPLYGIVRPQGHGHEEAQDLTQGFFAHLLKGRDLDATPSFDRKDEALQEAQHATELLPISQEALDGTSVAADVAAAYSFAGDRDRAPRTDCSADEKVCRCALRRTQVLAMVGSVARRSAFRANPGRCGTAA